jgi:hypothetical protein
MGCYYRRICLGSNIHMIVPPNGTISTLGPDLTLAVRILLSGRFVLNKVQREPGYALLVAHRFDEFGVKHRYCFALFEDEFAPAQVEAVKIAATYHGAQPVLVGEGTADLPSLEWNEFISMFGGPILSLKPFEPQFREHLRVLGHNRLPDGLEGKADDLFEIYVSEALGFVLGERVVRYGQDRLFEARPDGLVLRYRDFYALYDAKAYRDGYQVTRDSMRQFGSYVEDFSKRYGAYLQRMNAFLVVSGKFAQGDEALDNRSREFIAQYQVPLSFLTADALGEMVEALSDTPVVRRAVNWSRVFSRSVARPSLVKEEITTVLRDKTVGRR